MTPLQLASLVGVLVGILKAWPQLRYHAKEINRIIGEILDGGEPPTKEEWDELFGEVEKLHTAIQAEEDAD